MLYSYPLLHMVANAQSEYFLYFVFLDFKKEFEVNVGFRQPSDSIEIYLWYKFRNVLVSLRFDPGGEHGFQQRTGPNVREC